MGALPKRKISRIRRGHRRAHYLRLKMPHLTPCPQCNTLRLAHTVCHKCGTYNGVQVLVVDEENARN
jgi:large subunit ribosomal protein L32